MRPLFRFLLATLAGLVLGAIIHLVVVLALPSFANRDAFGLLEKSADSSNPGFITSPENESDLPWLRYADPATTLAVCPYDLTDGPFLISITGNAAFQSVSFYEHQGGAYFAVTDQTQVRGETSLILATEAQMAFLVQSGEYEEFYARNIRVTAPSAKGIAVLRVLASYPSLKAISRDTAALAQCRLLSAQDQQVPDDGSVIPHDLLPPRRGGR